MRRALALLCVAAVVAAAGCARIRMDTPRGFAPLEGRGVWRAVSPEGVRLQARWVDNEPRMSLDFWADALDHQLRREGYVPAAEGSTFQAGATAGRISEWSMPLGAERWTYLTAVVVVGKRILLVEVAGEADLYARHRGAILASLQTLDLQGR